MATITQQELDELPTLCTRLLALLADKHPGLFSWREAFADVQGRLIDILEGTTSIDKAAEIARDHQCDTYAECCPCGQKIAQEILKLKQE